MSCTRGWWMLSTSFLVIAGLGGCVTPYAESPQVNLTADPVKGTITLSDPKIFRREALYNERAAEQAWLDKLLADSVNANFKPEIVRELETITAFSAALGLKFDPAAGRSFRQSKEKQDIQQEIDTVKLQLQLEQLKRDVELYRAAMATQTSPVNADINKAATSSTGTTPPGGVEAATQLKAAIDKVSEQLANRLGADGKLPVPTDITSNPIELFRDRQAYRGVLQAAKNAANLDEMHDANGAALLRLHFQAMTVPDPARPKSLGVIQVKVQKPEITQDEQMKIYRGWIEYINNNINLAKPSEQSGVNASSGRSLNWLIDPNLYSAEVRRNFDIIEYS